LKKGEKCVEYKKIGKIAKMGVPKNSENFRFLGVPPKNHKKDIL